VRRQSFGHRRILASARNTWGSRPRVWAKPSSFSSENPIA
jgi:hypothetical protein